MKRLTEEETDDRDETSSESDESLHHIEKTKTIKEKNQTLHSNNKNKRGKEVIYH